MGRYVLKLLYDITGYVFYREEFDFLLYLISMKFGHNM
nr:hypothetical protein bcere0006_50010 [Bacillus wiedmannii]